MLLNKRINKLNKSYATEGAAIQAVERTLGSCESGDYNLVVVVNDGRHYPMVIWSKNKLFRLEESSSAGFFTTY